MLTPRYLPEPPYQHGQTEGTAVLLCNLGTPEAPTAPALRRYLAEFLSDPRVVEIPRLIWLAILHGIILRIRPAKSARKYASIWREDGSPLRVWTARQAQALQARIDAAGQPLSVRWAMRYGAPSIAEQLHALKQEGFQRILIVPAYPQYSATTTASVFDAVYQWGLKTRRLPEFRFINHYHDDPAYIQALAHRVRQHWQQHARADKLVMSFHGIPQRSLDLGDPYFCECHKTARLLAQALELSPNDYVVTFQSRFGRAQWLQPYTEPTLIALAQQGVQSVQVICPGFSCDCLETLEEIAQEVRDAFLAHGGQQFQYIACLNDSPEWIEALHQITLRHTQTWFEQPNQAQKAESQRIALAMGAPR